MNRLKRAALLIAALLVAGCEDSAVSGPAETASVPRGEGFDFYVLALSWSPSYCASMGERANRQQCDTGKPHGFVVHGLWPQFHRGYPTACETDRPNRVPRELVGTMLDIMPSTGLIGHEWREHGTCSELSQEDYFKVTRMAFEAVRIPDGLAANTETRTVEPSAVEAAFLSANPDMEADNIAVTCDRHFIRDVRICLSRDLSSFVACPEVDADDCRSGTAVMPPAR